MSMKAAACVGRVGGLAVALGVGAAVVTGYGSGVAWADTPDSSSSESSSSSSSSSESSTGASDSSTSASDSTQADKDTATAATEQTTGSEATTATSTGSTTSQAQPDVVVSTGGAHTSSESKEEEATAPTKNPKPKAEPAANPGKSADEAAEATGTKAPTTKVDAVEVKVDAVDVKVDADPQPVLKAATEAEVPVSSFAAQTMSSTVEMRTAAVTKAVTPPPRLWPTAFDPGTVVTYVGGLVSSFVGAALSPFAAGAPAPPADPPTLWTLLAWVRREFLNSSPTVNPVVNPQSTNGLITGNVGADDSEDDLLTYTVIGRPLNGGTVQVDEDGNFTYRPDERDGGGRRVGSVHRRGER